VAGALAPRLGREEQKRLTKRYTLSAEAYELYARGRYHALKATLPEIQAAISYFQQAIALDPSYALAYVGLADAYRSFPLNSDMPPDEFFPRAKAALQKAIEIDDTLAEAHAVLGFTIFWYDWDWSAAEDQFRRALELDPNDADAHLFYAHLLSNTGRHPEALAEAKRARELDLLNLRTNALEGHFLNHAGRVDEALVRLQKTLELDSNYFLAHLFAWSAYVEKGMYGEAAAEARRARELNNVSTQPVAHLAYTLAKSGKRREAHVELNRLLELSTERFVPPYLIALVYNGLGERDQALVWLERGFQQRDPKMVFLMVEPKWANLRSEPRFQDLLQRVGLKP
jgi:serine/threonine-protein kinase